MYHLIAFCLVLLSVAQTSAALAVPTEQNKPKKPQPAIEVIATLVPWADKEERVRASF